MKLEDQVAPLELARKMKALGFPQKTEFVWHEIGPGQVVGPAEDGTGARYKAMTDVLVRGADRTHLVIPICAAPTVAEMGEWLPNFSNSFRDSQFIGAWTAGSRGVDGPSPLCEGKTEAEARARLLIALAQAGAIRPQEIAGGLS